ncbi:nucleoside hydrolase [Microvirga lotononidis]|uniref:Inosine-uridine nucleoside N-ribohydrolase n=1 Tax=Microvirga lotononidis TaxID=864069 RepID=I4Z1E4_9HYPH|nr:nucleoside hydrolase [Microvirga lotononidis]EIM30036.1 Inosine-uridine nucleoside N-ribohydrolase [Microvirga lotononidis]WQO31918.1 nucleoside hydrolase [Microvirga lotononidis]
MLPIEKRARLILNTDAKNEADDQYTIVHALLTPTFDFHGIIPAHFGSIKSKTSLRDSHDEVMKILDLMNLKDRVRVEPGAEGSMPDEKTPMASAGARLIIEEGMKDDPRPLYVAFLGPLTDMAAALLMEPRLNERNICVVWIGGGQWPVGGREYNLSNDIHAANVVMKSKVQLWQIPMSVYRMMAVSYAELMERVYDRGAIGKYLVEQLIDWNLRMHAGPIEHRSLGDTPALSVILNPNGGISEWLPAPEFNSLMNYVHTGANRPIKVYHSIDVRYILEDFYAKLNRFTRGEQELANFV